LHNYLGIDIFYLKKNGNCRENKEIPGSLFFLFLKKNQIECNSKFSMAIKDTVTL